MPAGRGEEERFAAAVEHGTIPAFIGSGDDLARELRIVARLRAGAPALGPDHGTRERARQRMMDAYAREFGQGDLRDARDAEGPTGPLATVAPVALAERPAEPAPTAWEERPARRGGRHSAPEADLPDLSDFDELDEATVHRLPTRFDGERRGGHRRAALFGAAAAAALVALAGGGSFASRDALPGDQLYGVKRVAESTSYALTFGEDAKARRHLEQAQHRLDEVEGMVARDKAASTSGRPAPTTDPQLVGSTMQEFDTDTAEGSRLLLSGPQPDTAQVEEVQDWAKQQSARLSQIRSTMPAPARADESLALLDKVVGETEALKNAVCTPTESDASSGGTAEPVEVTCTPSDDPSAASRESGSSSASPSRGAETDSVTTSGRSSADDADDDQDSTEGGTSDDGGATSTTSSSSTSSSKHKRDSGSDGGGSDSGSGGSDGSGSSDGSSGAGDVSVPLPAHVDLPSLVPNLPNVLGGR